MVMARSNPVRRRAAIIAILAAALGLAALPLLLSAGSSGARARVGIREAPVARPSSALVRFLAAPAPPGWQRAGTLGGQATLFYPPGWTRIPGDRGTVTRALRDENGLIVGYLNATPREGTERLHGWAAFRTGHNREDGDRRVRQIAAAEGLPFHDARGSCVIDDYLSRVGGHAYREIACLVRGRHSTGVFIGAALTRDWPVLSGPLERAMAAFTQS